MKKVLFLMFTVSFIGAPFFSYAQADISERLGAVEIKVDDLSTRVSALEAQEKSRWSCSATCELSWEKANEEGRTQTWRARESVIAAASSAADAFTDIVKQCDQLMKEYEEKQSTDVWQNFFVSSESGTMQPNIKNACVK